jgi:phosphoglycerate dehydrogenase-like enzyme
MNILVSIPKGAMRDTFMPPDVVERINSLGNVEWNNTEKNWSADDLKEKLINIDICISGWGSARFDSNSLQNAHKLKIIAHTGGSAANIVSEELFNRELKVISGNWFFAQSLAEGTLAYMLSSLRDIPYYNNEVHQGRWREDNFYNEGILDQTIGLIGFGMTAKILVTMLKPFNVKIKVFSEHKTDEIYKEYGVQRASLEEIITTCKIISVHMAQRADTYHIISRELLKKIPAGSILVNTSRGSLIDEEALAEELSNGRFKAILDVYEVEPLPADSRLKGLKNVILIPHMGGPTIDRRKSCTQAILDDIERFTRREKLKFEMDMNYISRMTR